MLFRYNSNSLNWSLEKTDTEQILQFLSGFSEVKTAISRFKKSHFAVQ